MLKNKPMSTLSLALLLLVLTIGSSTTTTTTATKTASWPFWAHTTVQINNWLVSKAKLQVHCKEKTHDPGVHQLSYLESFKFKFIFTAISPGMASRSFDIYKQARDMDTCEKLCDWIVLESGPCLHHPENGIYNRCYHWNPKSLVDLPGASYPLSELLVNQTNQT
ncbi:hypothetical protein V2J09_014705 [Rumex salicifolius]